MALAQKGPLQGVKVVERVGRLAGSVCAARLADLGADVCRVLVAEDVLPNEPAAWRAHPFASSHGVLVELHGDDAAQRWQDLTSDAAIVIITPPVGADGIADTAMLRTLDADRQIICALSPFGLATTQPPLVDPGEAEMQAISGLLATTGDIAGRPAVVDLPILDVFTGVNAATAAVAALRVQEESGPNPGPGQLLDISVFETCFILTGTFLGKVLTGKAQGFRNGCRHPLVAPWNAYETRDGWVILCTTNNQNWQDITGIMGTPDLVDDPRFATAAARIGNVIEVDRVVGDWAAGMTTAGALEQLQGVAIPSGIVADTVAVATLGVPVPCRRTPVSGAAPVDRSEPLATPLQGVRVLEIGPYTAGPLAGRFLGNLGAEVIKIESPGGEDSRLWVPLVDGTSCYFANYNAGKKSVVLDLRTQVGKDSFLALVKTADVVMFNLKAGAMVRMGLGPEVLHKVNPRLIYCGISGYGLNGSTRPALDTVIQAEAGVISRIASDSGPVKGGFSIADLAAAHLAPQEIIAALRHARRTGEGVTLDISMYDTVAWMTGICAPEGGRVLPPTTLVQCADGWVLALGDVTPDDRAGGQGTGAVIAQLAGDGIRAVAMLELDAVYDLEVAKRDGLMVYEHEGKRGNCVITAPYAPSLMPDPVSAIVPGIGADTADLTGMPAAQTDETRF